MNTNGATISAGALMLARQANVNASVNLRAIEDATRRLAQMMEELHGGEWWMQIDHTRNCIMIFESGPDHIQKPTRGEVA